MWGAVGHLSLICIVAAFASSGLRPLGDPDLGWHLRTGELIVRSGFTMADPWSFASTRPWVLHEWGGEVVMYAAYALAGYSGVMALRVLLIAVLGWLVVRACVHESSPWIAVLASGLCFLSLWSRVTERPQLISFCLLAAVLPPLRIWIQAGRNPWWFPGVIVIWANVHAMWSAALVLYAALVVGRIIEVGVDRWRSYAPLVAIGALSGVGLILNPSGAHLLGIFDVGGAGFIGEFATPNLFDSINLPTTLLVAVIALGWARSTVVARPTEIAFVIASVFLGLMYNRTIPVTAIALAPLAARALHELIKSEPASASTGMGTARRDRVGALVLAGVFLIAAAVKLPSIPALVSGSPRSRLGSWTPFRDGPRSSTSTA